MPQIPVTPDPTVSNQLPNPYLKDSKVLPSKTILFEMINASVQAIAIIETKNIVTEIDFNIARYGKRPFRDNWRMKNSKNNP